MEFSLLGPLEASDAEGQLPLGSRKQRAVLAVLLLHANRTVAVERLIDELWGEDVPGTATKAVQVYVSQLRKVLPEGVLRTQPPGYVLEVGADRLDLSRFERLLADGRAALAKGDATAARDRLGEALGLWRGPALAEFATEPFGPPETARLEELHLAALEERIDADLALGRHAEVAGEVEALVARHPHRERLRAQLMLALYRSGRQADALAAYQDARRVLDEELGIEPSPPLRELERMILNQDEGLTLPAPAEAAATPRTGTPQAARPVGRDAELGRLDAALVEALAGLRRVVFVSGEPGLGKTTLVEAFTRDLDRRDGLLVAFGQCIEQGGAGEPYLPFLDALARLCREPGGDEVLQVLRRRAPSWLAQLPGLPAGTDADGPTRAAGGASRERMLRELLEALEELTAERTLVLVLEDLHWSDPSTIELTTAVARRTEPARLLVVGTYRPGDGRDTQLSIDRPAGELRLRGRAEEIPLGPLNERAVAEVVAARLPEVEQLDAVAAIVHERTGGNPLFVETLLEAWLADEPAWADVDPEDLDRGIPETLRQLIEQRLSALEPDDTELLEAASVAGSEFATSLVAAVLQRGEDDVERRCATLARRGEILRERKTEAWPDGTVSARFAFGHDLFHEVLYDRIPHGVRARLHQRVGERLEEAYGARAGEIASELAAHFVRARDAQRAVEHLTRAAERALGRRAPVEALAHVHAGLALVPDLPDGASRDGFEFTLRVWQGTALVLEAGWSSPEAEEAYTRATELAEQLGDPRQLGLALYRLANMYEVRGDYQRAEKVIAQSLAIPERSAGAGILADSHELMACSLFHQGSFRRALGHAEQGLEADEGLGGIDAPYGEDPSVACHAWAGLSLWFMGRPDTALDRIRDAILVAQAPERAHALVGALAQAAVLSHLRREPAECLTWAEAALAGATERGVTYRIGMAKVLRGWAVAELGDPAAGLADLREGLDVSRSTGARMDDPYYQGLLAETLRLAGDDEEAAGAIDDALERLRSTRTFFYEAELHRLGGDAGRAHELAREQGALMVELRSAVDLDDPDLVAGVLGRLDEGDDTHDLRRANELLARHGRTLERAPAEAARRTRVEYARSGEINIAYQVTGSGSIDLVLVPGFVSHLEIDWDEPRHAHFLDRLGSFSRLIRFDKRGTGLSDRPAELPDLETRMDDVRAVMDAAGSESAVLFGYSEGGPMAILFAATYPERVHALVLHDVFAKRLRSADYPWAPTMKERVALADELAREWGWEANMRRMCPNADEALARWWGERGRAAASPGAARELVLINSQIDVRHALPAVHVPTLVLHTVDNAIVRLEEARYIASRIPDAKLVELDGVDHFVAMDADRILDEVESFLARTVSAAAPPGATATRSNARRDGAQAPVRYARSGGLNVAYQITGGGAVDLVLVPDFVSHLELDWEEPRHARLLTRLGSFSRLIRFDKRSTGLSDRFGPPPDLEARLEDLRAVLDAAGSSRAVVFACGEGGPPAIVFAARYPERVHSLVLYGTFVKRLRSDDYPWAPTEDVRRAYAESVEREWGWDANMQRLCPNADAAMAAWWTKRTRAALSPGAARAQIEANTHVDVRDTLPAIRAPTLVLQRVDEVAVRIEEARYIASQIPDSRLVELPGADHLVAIDPDQIVDEIEEFVTGVRPQAESYRVLKTILVSDLVGSTETAVRLGDRAWSELLAAHHQALRDVLAGFGGEEVDVAGDGVLALFDGPARAIRAGLALRERLASLDLAVRVGIHTGEIEREGAAARGVAVHVTARVATEAGAGDVLVTATTRDLVAGSGLEFADRGERVLRGLDEPRRLYAVLG